MMSENTFLIPFSNPFPMFLTASGARKYTVFDDKARSVEGRLFTQRWAVGDRLSFQCSWYRVIPDNALSVSIVFEVNGTVRKTITHTLGYDHGGTMYDDFFVQRRIGSSSQYNGVYVFSQIIGEIKDGNDESILSAGDCFRIIVTDITGATWESDFMEVCTSTDGTKLFHYSNASDTSTQTYDTYFGYVPDGYDLRLPAYYTGVDMASEYNVFKTSEGGIEMVDSLPQWKLTVHVGEDGIGLPLHYVMLLNVIMSCDRKSIADFGDYEFPDGGFSKESFDNYGNEFYTAVIARKDNPLSQQTHGINHSVSVFVEEIGPEALDITVISRSTSRWRLSQNTVSTQKTVSKVYGYEGETKIRTTHERLAKDTDYTIEVVDDEGTVLATKTITVKASRGGLNYMKLGDTFVIR